MPGRKMYRKRRVARRGRNPRKMWRGRKGRLYSINKTYAYRRCNKTLIIQNSTGAAGTITTNDSTQITLGGPAAGTLGYDFGASMVFKLDNVQNYLDFTGLYDQYKITGVKITMIPLADSASSTSAGYLPVVYMAQDNDDGVIPTEGEIRQKNNVKMTRLSGPRSIYIKNPKMEADVGINGATSALARITNGWVNCADPSVLHNGLKLFFKNFDLRTTITNAVRFEIMYYLKFKAVQ